MKIIFTGTGSGKVSLNRYHSSIAIITNKTTLLVDAGDSVVRALLNSNINPNSVDVIFISHTHADHFCGLPSLITQMKMNGRTQPLKIIINESLIESLNAFLTLCYIFRERLGFDLQLIPSINNELVAIDDSLSFITRQNNHLDKYSEFNTDYNISLSSNSILFNPGDKSIFYTGDINNYYDLHIFDDYKINTFICEISHVSSLDVLAYIKKTAPEKAYITHIDDLLIDSGVLSDLMNEENIVFAYDGYKIEIDN